MYIGGEEDRQGLLWKTAGKNRKGGIDQHIDVQLTQKEKYRVCVIQLWIRNGDVLYKTTLNM